MDLLNVLTKMLLVILQFDPSMEEGMQKRTSNGWRRRTEKMDKEPYDRSALLLGQYIVDICLVHCNCKASTRPPQSGKTIREGVTKYPFGLEGEGGGLVGQRLG